MTFFIRHFGPFFKLIEIKGFGSFSYFFEIEKWC
jgi:hypothetical protein